MVHGLGGRNRCSQMRWREGGGGFRSVDPLFGRGSDGPRSVGSWSGGQVRGDQVVHGWGGACGIGTGPCSVLPHCVNGRLSCDKL